MARPGLMLYFDVLPALDKLPSAAVGELLLAALHYAQDNTEPAFADGSLEFAWAFLRPVIDRDGAAYEEKRLKGDWLTYCRQRKKDGVDALDFETWRERVDNGTLRAVDVSTTAPIPTTITSPSATSTPTQKQIQLHSNSAAAPSALSRDGRDLIFLDDGQYSALVADLGEQETGRCIDYLSEYCSTHGKRYHDWPAMIRKASRERWGVRAAGPASTPVTDFQPSAERIQKSADWLDKFLAEQEKKESGGKHDPGVTRL